MDRRYLSLRLLLLLVLMRLLLLSHPVRCSHSVGPVVFVIVVVLCLIFVAAVHPNVLAGFVAVHQYVDLLVDLTGSPIAQGDVLSDQLMALTLLDFLLPGGELASWISLRGVGALSQAGQAWSQVCKWVCLAQISSKLPGWQKNRS